MPTINQGRVSDVARCSCRIVVAINSQASEMCDLEGMGESENSTRDPGSRRFMKPIYFSKRLHPVHNTPPRRIARSTRLYTSRGMSMAEILAKYPPVPFKAEIEDGDSHSSNNGPADDDCKLVYTQPPPSPKRSPRSPKMCPPSAAV